jgi:hypothetical protein
MRTNQATLDKIAMPMRIGIILAKCACCICWNATKLEGESAGRAKLAPMRSPRKIPATRPAERTATNRTIARNLTPSSSRETVLARIDQRPEIGPNAGARAIARGGSCGAVHRCADAESRVVLCVAICQMFPHLSSTMPRRSP